MNKSTPSVETILAQAVEIASPAERQGFVEAACGGDLALQRRVEQLIANHFQAGSFLERPAVALDPDGTAGWDAAGASGGMGTVIGPYKLLEQIGEGGMGLVFVAEQQQPVKRRVALKIIKPGMDSRQVIARFEAERQALAMMDHPHIAKVFDGGTTPEGRPYFVMELVKGKPITDYCDRHRLAMRQRLALFLDVCHAVQHAHQKGIIHRDLKPSNVLVSLQDVTPAVKVIDFGIAKATSGRLTDKTVYTAFAQMVGTPLYMSPEQAGLSDSDVDTRSDVYALGVLLYELLTGTTPFDGETFQKASYDEMRRIIREDEPPRPSTRLSTMQQAALSTIAERRGLESRRLSQQLRGELDWVVMKALEKDRNRRYESASAFAADVQRYLKDEAVQACPPSLGYRMRKFAQRNRHRLAAAAVLLATGVLVLGILSAVLVQNADRRRQLRQDVQQSLAGAQTAIEANDLGLAQQRVAEAQGRLGEERPRLAGLAADVDRMQEEIAARQAAVDRYQKFLRLASDAQDSMGSSKESRGDRMAKEALALYGVLAEDEWLPRLESSYLTQAQKQQVRETAYVTLVSLADYAVRWFNKPESASQSLRLLARAQTFHEPTRAFYFVRSQCHSKQGNHAAADADVKRYKETAARTAWDYYLPGHTAGWGGDLEEAIRSYRAALAMQPDHYNSLFFLAARLQRPQIKRHAEALGLLTGCIALRPHHIWNYTSRAQCYQEMGELDAAEADYGAAIGAAETDSGRILAYLARLDFYRDVGGADKARAARAEKARQEFPRILELGQQLLKHLDTDNADNLAFVALDNLATACENAGRPQDAIAIREPMLKKLKAALGTEDPDTLIVMGNLGDAYQKVGRLPEAIALYEATLEKKKATLGPDHEETLIGMNNLGLAYRTAGRLREAIALHEQVLEKIKAKHGPDHKDTLTFMRNLANDYQKVGRLREAIALHEQVLEKSKAKLGPDHKDTLISMGILAHAYLDTNRLWEAIELYEPTLEKQKATLGPDHEDTFKIMSNLALAYQSAGRLREAIALLEPTLEKMKAKFGPDHKDTLIIMLNLALAYQNTGKLDQADRLLRNLLDRQRKGDDPKSAEATATLALLGKNLLDQRQYVESEPFIRECLAIREQKMPDDWRRYSALSMLGGALLGQKKYTEAEPLLLQGYEGMKQRETKIPPQIKVVRLAEAAERLVRLYEATNQPEKARTWREKLPSGKRPGR